MTPNSSFRGPPFEIHRSFVFTELLIRLNVTWPRISAAYPLLSHSICGHPRDHSSNYSSKILGGIGHGEIRRRELDHVRDGAYRRESVRQQECYIASHTVGFRSL